MTLGPLVTLTEISEHPLLQRNTTVLSDACETRRHAAHPQRGHAGRQSPAAVQCWYYRSAGLRVSARRGRISCYALNGHEPVPRHLGLQRLSATVAPSSAAVALLHWTPAWSCVGKRGKRVVALSDLYVKPDVDPTQHGDPAGRATDRSDLSPTRSWYAVRHIRSTARGRASTGRLPMPPWCWKCRETCASARPSCWEQPHRHRATPRKPRRC